MNSNIDPKLSYISVVNCKNRFGKYSNGRKVVGIRFINDSEALITTADSRLRIINIEASRILISRILTKNTNIKVIQIQRYKW